MVLRQPFQMPLSLRDQIDRWVPTTRAWGWVWRLEGAVFGQRKPVNIFTEFVSLPDSTDAAVARLSLGSPNFSDTNGLQVWLPGVGQLKALREGFQRAPGMTALGRPMISTADGMEARLFQGITIPLNGKTNWVGLAVGCCGRVHPDATDLMACITVSALVTNEAVAPDESSSVSPISIQTNLDTALRLQIPKGSGVFLLDGSSRGPSRKRIGVIIDPPQPKL